jgi:hypothetical protein
MNHADSPSKRKAENKLKANQNYYDSLSTCSSLTEEPTPELGTELRIGHFWRYDDDGWHIFYQNWISTRYYGGIVSSLVTRDEYYNVVGTEHLEPRNRLCTIVEEPEPQSAPTEEHKFVTVGDKNRFTSLFEAHLNGTEDQSGFFDNGTKLLDPAFDSITSLLLGTLRAKNRELQTDIDTSLSSLKNEGYTFIEGFRWCVQNWRVVFDSPIFNHVECLLSLAILAGWAPETWGEIEYQSISIYKVTSLAKFKSVTSIMDGIITTLNYFVESVYASWQQGSLEPFLYEHSLSTNMDERFEHVRTTVPDVRSGDFMRKGGDWGKFLEYTTETIKLYCAAIKLLPPASYQRILYSNRINNLQTWQMWIVSARRAGEITKQPFGIVYYGNPGCGKSALTNQSLKLFAAASGLEYETHMTANLTPDDKYESQMTNQTRFVVINDVANRPLKYDPSMGIAKALKVCDNITYVATKAEVDLKNSIMPFILACVASTNDPNMDIDQLSKNGNSLRRRLWRADAMVKPEYINVLGGIDEDKVIGAPIVMIGGTPIDAVLLMTLNQATHGGYAPYKFKDPSTGRTIKCENLELDEYFRILEIVYRQHMERQEKHVAKLNDFKFNVCKTCTYVSCVCNKDTFFTDDAQSLASSTDTSI